MSGAGKFLTALPTSRATLDWAQSELFPEAEAGRIVVVCMRAASYWGLVPGEKYGKALFAPNTTRNGFVMIEGGNREKIVRAIKRAMNTA